MSLLSVSMTDAIPDKTVLSVHEPAGACKGGVVVVQEVFGVNSHIEDLCRRFAGAGWLAVAPHLFWRSGDPKLGYTDKFMAHVKPLTPEHLLEDVDAALDRLGEAGIGSEHVGVVGFCMGGTIVLVVTARRDVGAGVTFYGGGVHEGRLGFPPLAEEATRLRAPWLGIFGDLDHGIPVPDVEDLRAAAARSGRETEVVRYPDAGHGFHCDQRPGYHDASARDAWQRTLAWFDRYVAAPSERAIGRS